MVALAKASSSITKTQTQGQHRIQNEIKTPMKCGTPNSKQILNTSQISNQRHQTDKLHWPANNNTMDIAPDPSSQLQDKRKRGGHDGSEEIQS